MIGMKKNFYGTDYELQIADAIFCNELDDVIQYLTNAEGEQFGYIVYYKPVFRLGDYQPSLLCPLTHSRFPTSDINSRMTVNSDTYLRGNGYLKFPVGNITAEEAMLAGSILYSSSGENNKYYLYTGYPYWTITPRETYLQESSIYVVMGNGLLYGGDFDSGNYIKPVINLKNNVDIVGTGTISDPFTVLPITYCE